MKVQSTFYIDFISKTVDVLLISSFITKQMPKLLIFDAFTLLICKKNVAIYALLRCKIFSLKIWLCKIFDKFHVCVTTAEQQKNKPYWNSDLSQASSTPPTFFISFHTSTTRSTGSLYVQGSQLQASHITFLKTFSTNTKNISQHFPDHLCGD